MTPWGTYLTGGGEFPRLFLDRSASRGGKPVKAWAATQAKSYERYGVPGQWQAWGKFHDRFNVDKEPNEPNRFGWIVEIDPFDPQLGAGQAHRARPLPA